MTRTVHRLCRGRKSHKKCGLGLVCALLPAMFFFLAQTSAETLRVTTWDLQESAGGASGPASPAVLTNAVEAAAGALKELDPDVILLQRVRDWRESPQPAQAVEAAGYNGPVWPQFGEPAAGAAASRQAAILSKHKAYFSWSEAWRNPGEMKVSGGFVFAAIQAGGHKVAVFSVELDDQLIQANSAKLNPAKARVAAA